MWMNKLIIFIYYLKLFFTLNHIIIFFLSNILNLLNNLIVIKLFKLLNWFIKHYQERSIHSKKIK